MPAPVWGDRDLCNSSCQPSRPVISTPRLPGEYLVAELGWRPVNQLPTILTAGVAVLVSPGGSDHKAQPQLGIEQD